MAHDKASSAQAIGWHLTSGEGAATARIRPGMHLGEDASGQMSFQSSDALVEFDIEDGTLELRVTSDSHELEVPERGRAPIVYVDPQTQVQLSFPSNTVSINTGSVTTSPVGDVLEIRVVPTSGDATSKSSSKPASGPPIARFLRPVSAQPDEADELAKPEQTDSAASEDVDEVAPPGTRNDSARDILVPEVLPVESSPFAEDETRRRDQSHEADFYTVAEQPESVSSGVTRAVIFAVVLVTVFVGSTYFIFQTQTQTQTQTPMSTPARIEPQPEAEMPTAAAPENQPGASVASPVGSQDASSSPAVESQTLAESQAPAESVESGNPELLAQIAGLVESEELPDTAAIDFAVQTLKTLRLAYPDDPKLRQSLEMLTERLASEAMLSYDSGDAIRAGRLIAQASLTGVAQESVSSALVYLAAAQAAAANRKEEPAVRAAAERSGTDEREVSRIEPGDGTVDERQGSQTQQVPAFQLAPRIYPYVAVVPQALGDQTGGYLVPDDAAGTNGEERATNRPMETGMSLDAEQPANLYPLGQLNLIRRKLPPYPRRAPDGAEGSVDLLLTITETGDVGGVEIIGEAPEYFTRAAMEAVLDWKFEPVFENGQATPVRTAVRVSFRP